jgi:hypothetical protein
MTINYLSSTILTFGFGIISWRFEISAVDASLVQSNPNALNVVVNGNLIPVNSGLYPNATSPPFGLLWNLYEESGVWYLGFLQSSAPAFSAGLAAWQYFDGPYTPLVTGVTESITISQAPQVLQPVYNPISFVFFSPKYAENGFRYTARIKQGTDTIANYTNLVPLADGSGYLDVQKVLSNHVSYDWFDGVNFTDNIESNFNSYIDYSVEFGQQYTTSWPYTNVVSYTANTFYSGYTVLNQTDPSLIHTYVLGDQITIDTITTGQTANISGLHEVVAVPSATQVVIDIPYGGTGSTIGVSGSTVYSDSRKVGFSNLLTISGLTAFNGALSWPDYKDYVYSDYVIPSSGDSDVKFLSTIQPYTGTNIEHKYYLTDFQNLWLNFYAENPSNTYYSLVSSDLDFALALPITIGPSSIKKTFISIDYLINSFNFNPNLSYIDVKLIRIDGPLNNLSKTYRFWRDQRCPIEEIQISFLDKMGSIISIPFTLRMTENHKVTREEFKQAIQYPSNTSLDLKQRGSTISNVNVEKTFDLNTNWMNDAQMALFADLIESPVQWVKFGDEEYQSCVVTDGGVEYTYQKNKKLFKKSVNIKLANQNPTNI